MSISQQKIQISLSCFTFLLIVFLLILGYLPESHAQAYESTQPANNLTVGQPTFIWWEGEDATKTNLTTDSWFAPQNDKERAVLSNGQWLTSIGKRGKDERYARYEVTVTQAGTYQLWCRKFWKHGPFRWRFDNQDWQTCGRDIALADSVSLRTHVGANWVHLGEVKLPKGKHTFEFRLLAREGEDAPAAFDAFVLVDGPFMPRGKLKPGEKSGQAAEGWFAYEPGLDGFAQSAVLDLRSLNEKAAGEHGFIQRKNGQLVQGDGQPIRLWGVNVSSGNAGQSRESVDYLARRLAKLGVNAVRFHSPLFDASADDPARIDKKKLDDLHYLVAAMKREGIYTKISFYFPLWFDIKPGYGIDGFDQQQNKKPFALLYFDSRMQEIHRAWLKQILTTKNPYTGKPLSDEPAVAMVEIVNEDSLFFWTFNHKTIPEQHWQTLEKKFGDWVLQKTSYRDLATFLKESEVAPHDRDVPAQGRLGLDEIWHLTSQGRQQANDARKQRLALQAKFLYELQRDYYKTTRDYIKRDLGYQGLVSASNWQTADPALLDALERGSYAVTDVIDRHGYFGGKHEGDGASYSVRVGHTFENRSALQHPESLPIQFNQIAGYPHIISEIGWPNPNRYRTDMMLLASAYGSLQDVDGFFFFANGSNYLLDQNIEKFQLCSPVTSATMPAAALAYRKGWIKPGLVVVDAALNTDDLFNGKGEDITAAQALDQLRKQTGKDKIEGNLAYYVGQVHRRIDQRLSQININRTALAQAISGSTITSATNEITLNHDKGLLTVVTPHVRAAAGFLKQTGPIELQDITIESGNEYASVMLVPLDDKPLAQSNRVLVQVMTEDQPFGYETQGNRITNLGTGPFNVRDIHVTLKMSGNLKFKAMQKLNANGYAIDEATPLRNSQMKLAEDAIYTILTR